MFKDILVHVGGSEDATELMHFAVDFAQRSCGRLTGIHVTPSAEPAPLYKPSQIVEASVRLASRLAMESEVAAAIFKTKAAAQLADTSWLTAAGDVAAAVSAAARYADIVILGQFDWQDPAESHPLPIAHTVALRCGCPVLVVPPFTRSAEFDKIVVAWDGSREAVRALRDALPLLQCAQSITILTVRGTLASAANLDTAQLVDHLARHGVTAGIDEQQPAIGEEHEQLRRSIDKRNADLLVMGGYSHPRWIEFVFGGATKSMLLELQIPVLVSH